MSQYRPKPPRDPDVRARMEAICAGLPSTSQKIRALHERGYSRSAIAGFLRKGYQHVRNVLTAGAAAARAHGISETAPEYEATQRANESYGVFEVDAAGRITLTPALLKAVDALSAEARLTAVEIASDPMGPRAGSRKTGPFQQPAKLCSTGGTCQQKSPCGYRVRWRISESSGIQRSRSRDRDQRLSATIRP